MTAGLEVELKLSAEDEAPLRLLAESERLGPAALGLLHEVVELDRYLDTADGRLAAARWACRLRLRGGALNLSLKGPAEHAAGDALHRRPELEGPATAGLDPEQWPPSEARDALAKLTGGQPLLERFALRQLRAARAVRVAGDEIGTLSIDRVTVLRQGQPRGAFLAVELELQPGRYDAALTDELLRALAAIPGLAVESRSKFEIVLGLPAGMA